MSDDQERSRTDAQPTAWILAHTRKSGAEDLEDVSGSAQRVGQADSVIMIQPNRDAKTGRVTASTLTLMKAREEPDSHPDAVTIEIANGKVAWTAGKRAVSGCTTEQLAKVRAFVESAPSGHPFTVSEVADGAGVRNANVNAAMRAIEAEGLLVARDGKSGWDRA